MVAREGEVLSSGFTNHRGAIRMPRGSAGAEVFVQGASYYGVRFPVPITDTTHVLPAGDILCGQIQIDGGAPDRSIGVAFQPEDLKLYEWDDTVIDHMYRLGLDSQLTDDEGSFRFSGFPAGWEGRLILPAHLDYDRNLTWRLCAGGPAITVPAVPMACLVGQTVLERDGTPMAGVDFTWTVEVADDLDGSTGWSDHVEDGWTRTLHGRTDHEGVFHAPLWYPILVSGPGSDQLDPPDVLHDLARGRAKRLVLEFLTHDGRYSARLERLDVDLSDGVTLGAVELTPSPSWTFMIQDSNGQPVPNAEVITGTDWAGQAVRTSPGGRAVLHGPRPSRVWIRADGLQARSLQIADEQVFPVVCTLPVAACLEVRIEGSAGLTGLRVRGEREQIFRDSTAVRYDLDMVRVGPGVAVGWGDDGTSVWFTVDGDEVALTDLVMGLPFEIDLLDHLGRPTGVREVAVLAESEVCRVAFQSPALGSITGMVVDVQGRPIPGAVVHTESPLSRSIETGENGRFTFHGVTDEPVQLRVVIEGVGALQEVMLRPGHGETRIEVATGQ